MATYQELLVQRAALDEEIEAARKVELVDAIKKVKAIVQQYGLTASQCGFSLDGVKEPTAPTRAPAQPKYITPDGKKTWSGRGRPPVEFKALIDAGKKIEDFLIK